MTEALAEPQPGDAPPPDQGAPVDGAAEAEGAEGEAAPPAEGEEGEVMAEAEEEEEAYMEFQCKKTEVWVSKKRLQVCARARG